MMKKSLSHLSPRELSSYLLIAAPTRCVWWSVLILSGTLWGCGSSIKGRDSAQSAARAEITEVGLARGSDAVDSSESEGASRSLPRLPRCTAKQNQSYQESAERLTRYVRRFIKEISRVSDLKGNLDLKLRLSRVMIAFSEDLIKRISLGQGCNSKEISFELEISPRTVETYHRKIREKLCIPHHDALVRVASLLFGQGGGHQQIDRESELLSAFESATLPEEQWDHNAHMIVAFTYLSRFSFERGSRMIMNGIKRLNITHNKPEAYHETVTVAYARLIKAALIKQPVWLTAQSFIDAHEELSSPQPYRGLAAYYHRETLDSDEARQRFVDADKQPLPAV